MIVPRISWSIDAGLEGMELVQTKPLPVNTRIIRLTFGFPGGVEKAHELRAIVVHHTQGMYGVTFGS
jgi:hypothetical protein